MPPVLSPFRAAAAEAVARALGTTDLVFPVTQPPDPTLGDFAVGAFPAAKALRAAPPALAQKVAAAFQATPLLAAAKATGPYVNFAADRGALYRHLFAHTLAPGADPIPKTPGAGKTLCIDYSSPNIAKPLSYHHIRSTTIGQSLSNLHAALGWNVIGINHLGDWGTSFGMLLAGTARWGMPDPLTIESLVALYVRFRNAAKEDPALEEEGRAWFKKLEDGDAVARERWRLFRDESLGEFQEVYDVLGVKFQEVRGESEYEADMPKVIALLESKGLTSHSEGALVVDLTAENMPPLLLRKDDGATLYATRDLAAAIHRKTVHHFTRSLYVVDRGQSLHFKQLFTVLGKAGFEWAKECEHIGFGLVRLGGKKAATRSGNTVLLKDVLAEATARIRQKLAETNPDLTGAKADEVAQAVGVGAVVFANLSTQRDKDIDFEWEDVLSFEGDAGPYIQYAHARTASILRRAKAEVTGDVDPTPLARPEEWALALRLTELGDEVARAAEACEPHVVARYLLDTCALFSRWYALGNQDASLKVLAADPAVAAARLALTAATGKILAVGLGLLGLRAPDEM
jgi:arginyl-tRNA synthetase